MQEGGTYTFDQSDSSNATHPLRFYTAADKSGGEYTTGVTTNGTPGSSGAYTRITVAASAPTLYYQCSSHAAMGGAVNTNSTFGSSNFAGSIQSTVQTNSDAGFSIVRWTGGGSAGTVGHGLSQKPEWMFYKRTSASGDGWITYHKGQNSSPANGSMQIQSDINYGADSTLWNNTEPTSSVISIGTYGMGSSEERTAWVWHGVEGYSKFGAYLGNGSSNGSLLLTGFTPSFLIIKCISNSSTDWVMYDNLRTPFNDSSASSTTLYPNLYSADASAGGIHFLSNGFKLKSANGYNNGLSRAYIYMAFAELPFFDDQSPVTAR